MKFWKKEISILEYEDIQYLWYVKQNPQLFGQVHSILRTENHDYILQ